MVKKVLLSILPILLIYFLISSPVYAIEYPLNKPNNKVGIHILFESELLPAAQLVNSNGGDWGYVTIPIQIGDKDTIKWQRFMDTAKKHHVIPILRLATEADPFNTKVWRKPDYVDIMDFANFLDSLDWPTKNRYIIILNEVNRGDEWNGTANPEEYAEILSFAVSVFKSKTPDFFIISAGLDNAAPNKPPLYFNQYDYMKKMNSAVPGIFNQIDGLASHSYPNPAFAQPPNTISMMGTGSFTYERQLAKSLSQKDLPVFITETGWSTERVSQEVQASYYQQAFSTVWNDPNVVVVAPFVLQGSGGPFQKFTFLDAGGNPTKLYLTIQGMLKTKGIPTLPATVLAAETHRQTTNFNTIPRINFSKMPQKHDNMPSLEVIMEIYKWLMKI